MELIFVVENKGIQTPETIYVETEDLEIVSG